jgi:hypothetical protein
MSWGLYLKVLQPQDEEPRYLLVGKKLCMEIPRLPTCLLRYGNKQSLMHVPIYARWSREYLASMDIDKSMVIVCPAPIRPLYYGWGYSVFIRCIVNLADDGELHSAFYEVQEVDSFYDMVAQCEQVLHPYIERQLINLIKSYL